MTGQEVLQIKPTQLYVHCPKCDAEQHESYDSEGRLILVCLICGHEWSQEELNQPDDCYANGEKIGEIPF